MIASVLFLLYVGTVSAQTDDTLATSPALPADTLTDSVPNSLERATPPLPSKAATDSLRRAAVDSVMGQSPIKDSVKTQSPSVELTQDTLLLYDYHNIGGVVALVPGVIEYGLGAFGHPSWLGYYGSLPQDQSINRDGMPVKDYITGLPRLDMTPFEDAKRIVIYPQHQAFWYGGNGSLLAVDVKPEAWNVQHPRTRFRHIFGPYEYLYTDVFFTLNPGPYDNLAVGLTRQTYGTNDAGHFRNSQAERWDLRLNYRYDITDRLRLEVGDRYNDYYTRMNGGVAGALTADSSLFVYPDPANSDEDALFDPILAELINPTILTKETRNAAYTSGTMKWFGTESMVTTARIAFENGEYQYEDAGYLFHDYNGFPAGRNSTNDKLLNGRSWTNFRMDATHAVSIGWAELELGGALSTLNADSDSGFLARESGVSSMVRGLLRFDVQPFRLTGFARLENTYGQNTFGFGGTLETSPSENLMFWGGISISTRPYSLFERYYNGDRTFGATPSDPDFAQHIITEGGIRFRTSWMEADARIFVRRSNRYLYIAGQMYSSDAGQIYPSDSLHSRFAPVWSSVDMPNTTSGISLFLRTGFWLLHLELRGAAMTQQFDNGAYDYNTAPDLQGSADFFLRANELLVSTLDLKAGAKVSYSGAYWPALYLSEQAWFALPRSGLRTASNVNMYTEFIRVDAYAYATIRRLATIHVLVYNALNERYITAQFYPMPDMGIQFGVAWLLFD